MRTEVSVSGAEAVVTVTDNGPGIPPEVSNRVFERFARGDASRTRTPDARTGGSTGLGLAIVAAVVEAHHGSVTVNSQPGHTQFTVRLPLGPPDAGAIRRAGAGHARAVHELDAAGAARLGRQPHWRPRRKPT